jgi:hypothetical protein
MKMNRKGIVLGAAALGIAAALATGIGVAQAETQPTPQAPNSAAQQYGHGGMYGMMAGQNTCLTAAASYLGLSQTDLQTQLRAGRSLADIAKAQGRSVSGLQDAMLAAAKSALDANTTLTAEQKAANLAWMKSQIENMVNSTRMFGAGGGMMGGQGRGMHGMMG